MDINSLVFLFKKAIDLNSPKINTRVIQQQLQFIPFI